MRQLGSQLLSLGAYLHSIALGNLLKSPLEASAGLGSSPAEFLKPRHLPGQSSTT